MKIEVVLVSFKLSIGTVFSSHTVKIGRMERKVEGAIDLMTMSMRRECESVTPSIIIIACILFLKWNFR